MAFWQGSKMPGEERKIITYFVVYFYLFAITAEAAQNMTKYRFHCCCLQRGFVYKDIDIYYLKVPVTFYIQENYFPFLILPFHAVNVSFSVPSCHQQNFCSKPKTEESIITVLLKPLKAELSLSLSLEKSNKAPKTKHKKPLPPKNPQICVMQCPHSLPKEMPPRSSQQSLGGSSWTLNRAGQQH